MRLPNQSKPIERKLSSSIVISSASVIVPSCACGTPECLQCNTRTNVCTLCQ